MMCQHQICKLVKGCSCGVESSKSVIFLEVLLLFRSKNIVVSPTVGKG